METVWRLTRFSVPADVDQDDLITLEGWTPKHGSLTLNPATALVLDGLQILHVSGPQARYGSLARRRVPAGQAVVWDKCRCNINRRQGAGVLADAHQPGYGDSRRSTW